MSGGGAVANVGRTQEQEELPIAGARAEILSLLEKHDFVIVVGDTGSGKTTQIPKYLLDADVDAAKRRDTAAAAVKKEEEEEDKDVKIPVLEEEEDDDEEEDQGDDAKVTREEDATAKRRDEDRVPFAPVAVTQPRRVAATSVSARVASERDVALGSADVGYKVRFDSKVGPGGSSRVVFMTDGVLVRECVGDKCLSRYNTVILDEAHERSVDTDVLFGLVKRAVEERKRRGHLPPLKAIVASATLDADRFAAYFDGAPVLRVPGRTFDVDIYHSKATQVMTKFGPASRAYVDQACDVVMQLHETQPAGHVLVFLTGQDEIERACDQLRRRASTKTEGRNKRTTGEDDGEDDDQGGEVPPSELLTLPLYGALQSDVASRVFDPVDETRVRKVVVATNIAETSLTVPGVRYVVDPGYVKLKGYDPARAVASLVVVPISKVAAEQRAGRAGRTAPGQCYRLYSRACFEAMAPETIPEIRRSSMSSVALALKSLDIVDVLDFDFVDCPDPTQLGCALLELHALGALDAANKGTLTRVGRAMATMALEPNLARCAVDVAHSTRRGVRAAVLSIAAMLSSEDVWYVDAGQRPSPGDRRKGFATTYDERKFEAMARHAEFRHPRGDLISLLVVFAEYDRVTTQQGDQAAQAWTRHHSLRLRSLRFARKARDQLDSELTRVEGHKNNNNNNNNNNMRDQKPPRDGGDNDDHHHRHRRSSDGAAQGSSSSSKVDLDGVCEALCAGLCLNAAERTLNDGAFLLMPSPGLDLREGNAPKVALVRVEEATSAAFKARGPDAICFHELRVGTNSKGSFARNMVAVKPDVLAHARRFIGTSDPYTLSGKDRPTPETNNDADDDDDDGAPGAPGSTKKRRPAQQKQPMKRRLDVGAAAPSTSAPDVDSAKARYLARKRHR